LLGHLWTILAADFVSLRLGGRPIFPVILAFGGAKMHPVLDKFKDEHKVIHALLEALGEQVYIIRTTPNSANYAVLREIFERLEAVVRSHFGYQEQELTAALGFYQIF
jgi:hypothetical protein